jgi:hypothetical protein
MQLVNIESVRNQVNTTNSFTREFMSVPENRELVRQLRSEKKERLMSLTPSQIGTLIEARGLQLVEQKEKTLKNGTPVITLTLKGATDEGAKIRAQIAKLQAKLANV